nr:MAG TPA: hypothetical protein [Caudoviricetes sp.]
MALSDRSGALLHQHPGRQDHRLPPNQAGV